MTDLELRSEPFDGPSALVLIEQVQAEYVHRYGGPDATLLDPAEFAPPHGRFFVGYLDGQPIVCGGWRMLPDLPATAEIKRMYVALAYRNRGLARLVLAALEDSAREAGVRHMWLETGTRQPEALALYQSSGYGHYRDAPLARPMGKSLV